MLRRILVQLGLVALVFGLGFWLSEARTGRADAKSRVFELRTYTTNEGKLDALQARFRNHTTRLFEKYGMVNVGYWIPTDPAHSQNTLIYILAHDSKEAAEKSWNSFRADPEWIKVKSESEKEGTLVSKVDSVYMKATDFSKLK